MIQIYSNSNNIIVVEDQLASCPLKGIQEGKRIAKEALTTAESPKLGLCSVWDGPENMSLLVSMYP